MMSSTTSSDSFGSGDSSSSSSIIISTSTATSSTITSTTSDIIDNQGNSNDHHSGCHSDINEPNQYQQQEIQDQQEVVLVEKKSSIFNISINISPVIRLRPSWNKRFGSTIKALRVTSNNAPKNIKALRLLTDHSIPSWLPVLPRGVTVMKSAYPHPPGEWFYPTATGLHLRMNAHPTAMQGKYILYFHGGAFCTCSTGTHRSLLMRIVKDTGGSILAVDYRRPPEHPYPTPVDDCLSAYLFLLEKIGNPDQIVLAGDSAGGNLVLSTLLRIAEHGFQSPAGAILLSPWVDLTDNGRLPSWDLYRKIDYLPADMAKLFAIAYLGEAGAIDPWAIDPNTSPLYSENLHRLPPLLVEFGECEVLHDQIMQFCKKVEESGVNIEYNVREDMVHVFPIYSFTGMKQCSDAFEAIVNFLNTTHPHTKG